MRPSLTIVAFAQVCAWPAAALDLPARKAGLWEIKMAFEGRTIPPQTMQQCIDAATDKQMNSIGGNMAQERCSKQDVQKVGATIVVDSVCQIGATKTTSHGVISGDFNSAYTVKVSSTREGGPAVPGDAGGRHQQHDHGGKMARRLQGRPEAGRHDHGQRNEGEYRRHAEAAADAGPARRDAAAGDAGRAAAEEVSESEAILCFTSPACGGGRRAQRGGRGLSQRVAFVERPPPRPSPASGRGGSRVSDGSKIRAADQRHFTSCRASTSRTFSTSSSSLQANCANR